MVYTGEKVAINITIHVTAPSAPALNFGEDTLDDILILHTEGGKDHFISIQGQWLESSFGNDINVLIRCAKPLRTVGVDGVKALREGMRRRKGGESERKGVEGSAAVGGRGNVFGEAPSSVLKVESGEQGEEGERLSVPKEVWRLVDFIYKYGMDVVSVLVSDVA